MVKNERQGMNRGRGDEGPTFISPLTSATQYGRLEAASALYSPPSPLIGQSKDYTTACHAESASGQKQSEAIIGCHWHNQTRMRRNRQLQCRRRHGDAEGITTLRLLMNA